jgi:hypothetical protein
MRKGQVPIDGVVLERKFARLLAAVRRNAKPARNADYLAQQFGEEQRRILFVLLDDIEEQIAWHGFSHARAYDLVHEHKLKKRPLNRIKNNEELGVD